MIVITVARKPVEGTVSSNVLKHGTGGLNVDSCRIPTASWDAEAMERVNSPGSGRNYGYTARQTEGGQWDGPIGTGNMDTTKGRWPANVILSDAPEVLVEFPQAGGGFGTENRAEGQGRYGKYSGASKGKIVGFGDSGSAARFFKQVKE